MKKECEICSRLNENEMLVLESPYWKVFVHADQSYLGRCVVSLKRHAESLSTLTLEEKMDFFEVVRKMESASAHAFGAANGNWSCLMNNAFQTQPYNPHVHWHFHPRYAKPITFEGETFTDPQFGHHHDPKRKQTVEKELLHKIRKKIIENIK